MIRKLQFTFQSFQHCHLHHTSQHSPPARWYTPNRKAGEENVNIISCIWCLQCSGGAVGWGTDVLWLHTQWRWRKWGRLQTTDRWSQLCLHRPEDDLGAGWRPSVQTEQLGSTQENNKTTTCTARRFLALQWNTKPRRWCGFVGLVVLCALCRLWTCWRNLGMRAGPSGTPPVTHPFPTGPTWLGMDRDLQDTSRGPTGHRPPTSHLVPQFSFSYPISAFCNPLSFHYNTQCTDNSPGGKNNVPTIPFWRISILLTPGAMYQRSVVTAASSVLCPSLGDTCPSSKDIRTTNGVSTFFFLNLWKKEHHLQRWK